MGCQQSKCCGMTLQCEISRDWDKATCDFHQEGPWGLNHKHMKIGKQGEHVDITKDNGRGRLEFSSLPDLKPQSHHSSKNHEDPHLYDNCQQTNEFYQKDITEGFNSNMHNDSVSNSSLHAMNKNQAKNELAPHNSSRVMKPSLYDNSTTLGKETHIDKIYFDSIKAFTNEFLSSEDNDNNGCISALNTVLVRLRNREIALLSRDEETRLTVHEMKYLIDSVDYMLPNAVELLETPSKYVESYICFCVISTIQFLIQKVCDETLRGLLEKPKDDKGDDKLKDIDTLRMNWLKEIRHLNKTLQKKKLKIGSLSALGLEVTKMELLVISLPDPNTAKKAMAAGAKIARGIVKSFMTMRFDLSIVNGIADMANVGMSAAQRALVKAVTDMFADFDQVVVCVSTAVQQCEVKQLLQSLECDIQDLHDTLFDEQSNLQRWEIYAAFSKMIAEVIICLSPQSYISNLCLKSTGLKSLTEAEDRILMEACAKVAESVSRLSMELKDLNDEDFPVVTYKNGTDVIEFKLSAEHVTTCKEMERLCIKLLKGDDSTDSRKGLSRSLIALLLQGSERSIVNKAAEFALTKLSYWFDSLRTSFFGLEEDLVNFNLENWLRKGLDLVFSEGAKLADEMTKLVKHQTMKMFGELLEKISEYGVQLLDKISDKDTQLLKTINEAQSLLVSLSRKIESVLAIVQKALSVFGNLHRLLDPKSLVLGCKYTDCGKKLSYFLTTFDDFEKLAGCLRDPIQIDAMIDEAMKAPNVTIGSKISGSQVIHNIFSRFRKFHQYVKVVVVQLANDPILKLAPTVDIFIDFEEKMIKIEDDLDTSHGSANSSEEVKVAVKSVLINFGIPYSGFIKLLKEEFKSKLTESFAKLTEIQSKLKDFVKDNSAFDIFSFFGMLKSTLVTVDSVLSQADLCLKKIIDAGEKIKKLLTVRNTTNSTKFDIQPLKIAMESWLDLLSRVSDLTVLFHVESNGLLVTGIKKIASTANQASPAANVAISVAIQVSSSLDYEFSNFKASFNKLELDKLDARLVNDIKGRCDDLSKDLKSVASTLLQNLGENLKPLASIGEVAIEKLNEFGGGELLSSMFGAMDQLMKAQYAELQQYRVREVAAMWMLRLSVAPCGKKLTDIIAQTITDQKIFGDSTVRAILRSDAVSMQRISTLLNSSRICLVKQDVSQMVDPSIKLSTELLLEMKASRMSAEKEKETFAAQQKNIYDEIKSRMEALDAAREAADKEIDMLKKQEILYNIRLEQVALKAAIANLDDLSKKLDVIVHFLSDMQGQLDKMDMKLDVIQKDITSLRDDMLRVTGRRPLDVIKDWEKNQQELQATNLLANVYVEGEVCGPGPRNDFRPTAKDNATSSFDDAKKGGAKDNEDTAVDDAKNGARKDSVASVVDDAKKFSAKKDGENSSADENNLAYPVSTVFEKFLNDKHNILLLSGEAGCGKTTALEALKQCTLKRGKKGKKLIVLPVPLSMLRDPVSSIIEEGFRLAYGLSPNQIQELKDSIQKKGSNLELVILLDAYDELRPDALGKNLWATNNLEQYRDQSAANRKEASSLPKVVISCRSEYLSEKSASSIRSDRKYTERFLPIESTNTDKTKDKAREWLIEYRFIPFGDKKEAFQSQYVSINWRNQIMKMLRLSGTPAVSPPKNNSEWFSAANVSDDSHQKLLEDYFRCTTTTENGDISNPICPDKCRVLYEAFSQKFLSEDRVNQEDIDSDKNEQVLVLWMVVITAVLFNHEAEAESIVPSCMQILEDGKLWLPKFYNDSFKKTKELEELTTTPFMVEVVTEILPTLKQQSRPLPEIKNSLSVSLGDSLADKVWLVIGKKIGSVGILKIEAKVEKQIEMSNASAPTDNFLENIAEKVVKSLYSMPSDAPKCMKSLTILDLDVLFPKSLLILEDNMGIEKSLVSIYGEKIAKTISASIPKDFASKKISELDSIVEKVKNKLYKLPTNAGKCSKDLRIFDLEDNFADALSIILEKDMNMCKRLESIYGLTIAGKISDNVSKPVENIAKDMIKSLYPTTSDPHKSVKGTPRKLSKPAIPELTCPEDAPKNIKKLKATELESAELTFPEDAPKNIKKLKATELECHLILTLHLILEKNNSQESLKKIYGEKIPQELWKEVASRLTGDNKDPVEKQDTENRAEKDGGDKTGNDDFKSAQQVISALKECLKTIYGEKMSQELWREVASRLAGDNKDPVEKQDTEYRAGKGGGTRTGKDDFKSAQRVISILAIPDAPDYINQLEVKDLESHLYIFLSVVLEKGKKCKEESLEKIYGKAISQELWKEVESQIVPPIEHEGPVSRSDIGGNTENNIFRSASQKLLSRFAIPEDAPDHLKSMTMTELKSYLGHCLLLLLNRPRLRRNTIFASFIENYMSRALQKAMTSRSAVAPEVVAYETCRYCRELAVYLIQRGKSKLERRISSQIFMDDDDAYPFFHSSEVANEARNRAPVREASGSLSFIHKTLQEYFAAEAIITSIADAVEDSMVSFSDLEDIQAGKTAITSNIPLLFALSTIAKKLNASPLTNIGLDKEVEVVDFIVDFIMGSSRVVSNIEFVFKFLEVNRVRKQTQAHDTQTPPDTDELVLVSAKSERRILENLWAILASLLPRRNQQTLLHVACAEGLVSVVSFVFDLIRNLISFSENNSTLVDLIDEIDMDSKTPLFLATAGGHAEVLKVLLDNKANASICGREDAVLELLSRNDMDIDIPNKLKHDRVSGSIKVPYSINDKNAWSKSATDFGYKFLVGCPAAVYYDVGESPSGDVISEDVQLEPPKCYMYEVDVVMRTNGHPMFIGWSSDCKKVVERTKSIKKAGKIGYLSSLKKLTHVGMDGNSIGMHMFTHSCNISLSGHAMSAVQCEEEMVQWAISTFADKQNTFTDQQSDTEELAADLSSLRVWSNIRTKCTMISGAKPIVMGLMELLKSKGFKAQPIKLEKFKPVISPKEREECYYTCSHDESVLEMNGDKTDGIDAVVKSDSDQPKCVGTALDFINKRVHFAVDGVWDSLDEDTCKHLFDNMSESNAATLFPALSSAHGNFDIQFNFGHSNFKYPLVLSGQTGLKDVVAIPVSLACTGISPLMKSAERGDWDSYKLLQGEEDWENMHEDDGKDLLLHLVVAYNTQKSDDWFNAIQKLRKVAENSGSSLLLWASQVENPAAMKFCFSDETLVNEIKDKKNQDGETALMLAILEGNREYVERLLEVKVDLNVQNNHQLTALMMAVMNDQSDCVNLLVEAGADINIADEDGDTALMYACLEGHDDYVQKFLATEAHKDIDIRNNEGFTALMWATVHGYAKCVTLLLEKGADMNMMGADGNTALMLASSGGQVECVDLLLENGANKDIQDTDGNTAFMLACSEGHEECALVLLEKGADKDMQDTDGNTALMLACSEGHEECVSVLLNAGANKDKQNEEGYTALMLACKEWVVQGIETDSESEDDDGVDEGYNEDEDDVEFWDDEDGGDDEVYGEEEDDDLWGDENEVGDDDEDDDDEDCSENKEGHGYAVEDSGIDGEDKNAAGDECSAGEGGHTSCVKKLLESGANVNITNNDGLTALMLACQSFNRKCAGLLLSAGANDELKNKDGFTAFHIMNKWTTLMLASFEGREDDVNLLLEDGDDKDSCDISGFTALMLASMQGHVDCVKLLVDAGAYLDSQDEDGSTAYILARKGGHEDCIKLLAEAGANTEIFDVDIVSDLLNDEEGGDDLDVDGAGGQEEGEDDSNSDNSARRREEFLCEYQMMLSAEANTT